MTVPYVCFYTFFLQDLVFAILVANNQLVTLVRPKKYSLHPSGELEKIITYS
jgi:hypothetical protein